MLAKMLTVLVVIVMMASVAAGPRQRRQLFDGQVDTKQVGVLLRNEAFVKIQVKCALASETKAAAICDRVGHLIRKNLPTAIRTLVCPGNCTVRELKAIVEAHEIVTSLYPDQWKLLTTHYKITEEQFAALDKWLENVRSLPNPDKARK